MVGGFVGVEWMNQHLAWISEHVRSTPGAELDAEGVRAWNRLTIDEIKSTCRTPWTERSN